MLYLVDYCAHGCEMEKKTAGCERNIKDRLERRLGGTADKLKQKQAMEEKLGKQAEELLELQAKFCEQEKRDSDLESEY